jgi:hypothetical protein
MPADSVPGRLGNTTWHDCGMAGIATAPSRSGPQWNSGTPSEPRRHCSGKETTGRRSKAVARRSGAKIALLRYLFGYAVKMKSFAATIVWQAKHSPVAARAGSAPFSVKVSDAVAWFGT